MLTENEEKIEQPIEEIGCICKCRFCPRVFHSLVPKKYPICEQCERNLKIFRDYDAQEDVVE